MVWDDDGPDRPERWDLTQNLMPRYRKKMKKPERWSLEKARAYYDRGATFDQLAARYWLAPGTIRKRLVAAGLQPRPRGWRIPVADPRENTLQSGQPSGDPTAHEPQIQSSTHRQG